MLCGGVVVCIYECGVIYMVLVGWCECIGVVGGGGNTLPMGRGWLLTMLGGCGSVLSIYECG